MLPTQPAELPRRLEGLLRGPIAQELGLDPTELSVVAVEDGIASVRLAGACASCPASLPALLRQLEDYVRREMPEIEMIEAVL